MKHKFSLIHISMNQITKVDCNAFLWESESGHISLLYHFRGDSTLVSWIANVRDWSKQKNSRFRQRLWWVPKRWNQSDFHKFSWSPADFLFSTLKSQFYSYVVSNQKTLLAFTFINSGQPPQHKGKKTHASVFSGQKFHLHPVV